MGGIWPPAVLKTEVFVVLVEVLNFTHPARAIKRIPMQKSLMTYVVKEVCNRIELDKILRQDSIEPLKESFGNIEVVLAPSRVEKLDRLFEVVYLVFAAAYEQAHG